MRFMAVILIKGVMKVIVQMMKLLNPEHAFYVPYLHPIKANVEQSIKEGKFSRAELENFVLPKEASIYVDDDGVEGIYVNGLPVNVFTEIPSGIVRLINNEVNLIMERHTSNKKGSVIPFPSWGSKAV